MISVFLFLAGEISGSKNFLQIIYHAKGKLMKSTYVCKRTGYFRVDRQGK